MVTSKREILVEYQHEDSADILISKLLSLLEMGISAKFEDFNFYTWHNYLCVLDDIAIKIGEKI